VAGIVCVAFSPQGDLVAWLGEWCFGLLHAVSGTRLIQQVFDVAGTQSNLAWAADGTQLLTSDSRGMVRVWDVASAESTKRVHPLFECDTSHRTTSCSFFDSHRFIVTDHGFFPIPVQYRPPCAADDFLRIPPETLLRLRQDGWIWRVGGTSDRRVCWLPLTYRRLKPIIGKDLVISQDKVMLIKDSRRLAVLDLKKWVEYANSDS
jgi:hypothetical protein